MGISVYRAFPGATQMAAILAVCAAGQVWADDVSDHDKMSADELANKLADPNSSLATLNFLFDYISYTGDLPNAGSQDVYVVSFQPTVPYPLGDGLNFFFRPLFPVFFDQPTPIISGAPVPDTGDDFFATGQGFRDTDTQLGDISFDAAIGKTFSNGVIMVGGMVGTLDTATDNDVGLGQTLLGPELLLGYGSQKGFLALLVNHQWDVAGNSDFDTSITGGQYMYTYNLKNAWQIQAQPTWSYDHEANGDKWTFPLATGISKTLVMGNTPVRLSLEYWHFIEQADAFGPDWQIRFKISPVIPLPW